ncbi:centrosome-associated protein 350 isoform X2 [Dendropsophus ebraccatus]|uniref:centrosome-associated protein 350 isoform X2 n=1 Tax=Dendropsophus ebraccatus TaxID=150705 RepID=UPI0038316C6B
MAEKSLWRTSALYRDLPHQPSRETIQEISKAWKTISDTKAALRHTENKLDVAPTSSAVFDPIMDTKRAGSSATRKISRKDGRYHEDPSAYHSRHSHPTKAGRERSSRSPLRVTTLDSNVKSSCRVGFREPLASYREVLSSEEKGLGSALKKNVQEEAKDFDSTRSSAVDETTVRYLNDRLAIDNLHWQVHQSQIDRSSDYRTVTPTDPSQHHPTVSPLSNRLETLKRRQPDAKLEKLKERIRRQWELSEERDSKERLPESINVTENATNTKTRKVTTAPPAPSYRGFNPPEMKIRTPDGKVWAKEEFQNLSTQIHGALATSFQEGSPSNEKSSREKRTSRPVRKVQRLAGTGGEANPDGKTGHIISTSSWRDGQKLIKQILGPAPKAERESKSQSNDHQAVKGASAADGQAAKRAGSKERISEKRTVPSERQKEKRSKSSDRLSHKTIPSKEAPREDGDRLLKPGSSSSQSDSRHAQKSSRSQMGPASKIRNSHSAEDQKHQDVSAEVKKDFLPLEIRGILDDLQLDSGLDCPKQTQKRSHSPAKRKSEKGQVSEEPHASSKRRHYDSEQVRMYIMRQQEERKKKQNEQKAAQRQAEEQKNKRLQELYQKQREAFSKAKNITTVQREKEAQEPASHKSLDLHVPRPQDTYSKLLLGETWPPKTEQEKQSKPLYQPSGESDKENKGQERPPSASSSSDLSLSEPLQPLLRSDLVEAYCPDKLTAKGSLPQSQFLALPKDLESLLNPRKNTANMFPASQKTNVTLKTSTDFKSNLDRIESLKATAMSLSSRIENEAKKLAGTSLTLPLAWSSEPEPKPSVKIAWRKPDSPPERESRVDAFSNRIQKMLSTCSSHFSQEDLPGTSHLYRKLPEELTAHSSSFFERYDDKEDKKQSSQKLEQGIIASGSQKKASPTPNSSTSSISEGPILSEDSFSEGEGQPRHASHPHPAETLTKPDYCVKDYRSLAPFAEFQREADKYPPLASSARPDFQGPWEELTKGSPHSVINIFTRTFQQHGKALKGYEGYEPDLSAGSPQNSLSYADDFISSHVSESATDSRKEAHHSEDTSASSAKEELPLMKPRSDASPHSSHPSSAASSPLSASSQRGSTKRKVWQNNSSPLSVKVEQNSSGSENKSQGSKQTSPVLSASKDRSAGSDSDSTMGDVSSRSVTSLMSDTGKDIRSQPSSFNDVGGQVPAPSAHQMGSQAPASVTETGQDAKRFSPAGLHQRLSAELTYLSAMEESVRQLCDVERVRGISLAQQESVSLAQILKAQQQRHEQNLAALRQQAEQEAQASMRQLEEAQQMAAKTQAEMLQRFQKTIESCASQNGNRLHEEPDRGYLSPTSSDNAVTSPSDQQKRQRSHGTRKKGSRSASPSSLPPSSVSSFKERSHSSSSSEQDSQPASSIKEETTSHRTLEESISEELPTPERSTTKGDTSLSIAEKGASSAEPRNEEGIEELSFRSLLPSESHRRGSLERQRSRRHESDEESTPEKEMSGPFSSGQDSFWKFTMEMVRQYMQEGEMRSAHQAALLRLRQKALKDKTKAELAWLEHQKRRLRDKGEDDKMPPLRKRQRGLLLRLQQEQAEIKRLQEANKAARRERQLILKQQEEIQRIQNSTLRLQEKLKSAESGQLEQPSEGDIQPSAVSSHDPSEAESRSPSPVSVSGSETSSIMQKLRKMHSHMDAKFLTKREQQLVQRRLHAQELLEWKRRLDAEELEIRQIEKQALAAWDNQRVKTKGQSTEDPQAAAEDKRNREGSSAPPSPTIQTRTSLSPPPEYLFSEGNEQSTIAEQIHEQSGEQCSISEELAISGPSKMSPPRSSRSPAEFESSKESVKTGRQKIHITLRPHQLSHTWSEESLSMTHSEATSDQSDIEGRIRALKEELKKRKSVVENLKREQRRRQKERLRAQEAILLQQLQSYDEYIQKTQAELSGEQGTVSSVKSVPKSAKEVAPIRSDFFQRTDSTTSYKGESEHVTEISSRSNESTSPEKSLASEKETVSESIHEKSAHTPVPFSAKDDSPSAGPPSPTIKEPLLSAHDSPVSSIQSEIPEDMLDTQSNRSVSPLPALDLKLGSETPEENVSPHRDHSYSEDFETSTAFKPSVSETPREELDSYATTPGRDISGEGFYDQEEFKASSPNFQLITESREIQPSSDLSDPLAEFQLGDRVLVSGVQPGTLRFKGETLFADGVWAGVELDKAEGNNDGSLGGNRYFVCSPLHGIFAPPQKIALLSLEEHISSLEVGNDVESSFEPKGQVDDITPLADDIKSQGPAKTSLKSTESSESDSHRTLIEQEPQVAVSTDISIPDEERTPLLELTEKYSEARIAERAPEVSTLSDSLLQACLKDTVSYLQSIRKQRAQKIQQSNEELHSIDISDLHKEEKKSPKLDEHQKLDSLHEAFGEKEVTEFEPSRNILSILGEEPDWFDEDFGLSSRKNQQLELERALSSDPVLDPKTLIPRHEPAPKSVQPVSPPEPIFAVPHTVPEVEQLVEVAVDKLWEWKQLNGDLQEIRNCFTQNMEEQSPAYCAYKEMLFDLTLYIVEEICSPDPRGSQPLWKKPVRMTPSYSRRVKDPNDMKEVKSFLISEVLHLLSLRKEHNQKTDWQRMMKFGRKKRDRVDHILVQELHEEEAQWVNYDEDELFVKMQLADGIFEALIRDTIQVLQSIQNKRNQSLHV